MADRLTRSGDSGVHPALAILDGFGSITQVVLEDLGAAGPSPRAHSVFEGALPLAFQQAESFASVDLMDFFACKLSFKCENKMGIRC